MTGRAAQRAEQVPRSPCPQLPADAAVVAEDDPLSWWATAPRHGFTTRAAKEAERMRGSKGWHLAPVRYLE